MNKLELLSLYNAAIKKYEGEVKGFQIMLRREELSGHTDAVKQGNCQIWKKDIRRANYNLTRARNLRMKLLT